MKTGGKPLRACLVLCCFSMGMLQKMFFWDKCFPPSSCSKLTLKKRKNKKNPPKKPLTKKIRTSLPSNDFQKIHTPTISKLQLNWEALDSALHVTKPCTQEDLEVKLKLGLPSWEGTGLLQLTQNWGIFFLFPSVSMGINSARGKLFPRLRNLLLQKNTTDKVKLV